MNGARRRVLAVGLVAVLTGAGLTGCSSAHDRHASDGSVALTVNIDSCGKAWSRPDGGPVTFAITNAFYNPMDAYLTDARTGAYLAEYEGIGTGATLDQTVTLANGSYRFVCFPADEPGVRGPVATVSGASGVRGTPEVVPVSPADLIGPSSAYKRWIASRLPVLRREVEVLAADLRSGATARAKADWLTAHLTYETLGAAYDAFSSGDVDFDGLINGSGFHDLEALLWAAAPSSRLVPAADALVRNVGRLIVAFPTLDVEPNDLPLRAHEIVENAIQFELTGETDAGSHTNLATAWANLTGAQHALVELLPILRTRYPALADTQRALASTKTLLASLSRGGRWPALGTLTQYQRARVNGAFQHAVELLAPVAAICDVREVIQP